MLGFNGYYNPWNEYPQSLIALIFFRNKSMRIPKLVAFGQKIRDLRKSKGLSQEELSELAGLDRSYMGHIERGEKNVSLLKIYQISEALNVHISLLF